MEDLQLTEEEKANVEKLRTALADIIGENEMAAAHADDFTLWRFLTARQNDLKKAEEMFRGAMEWRKTCYGVGIDALWESKRVKNERTVGDGCFYGGLSGVSKAGGCVMVERIGKVDAKGLVRDADVLEQVLQAYTVYLERAFRFVRATGNKTRAVVIVDLEGLSMSHIYNISVIKKIASIGPANYPEVTCGVFIIKAPMIFTAAWKIIRPMLPAHTQSKVNILGSDFMSAVQDKVSDEHLPTFLGGSATPDDGHDNFDDIALAVPPAVSAK
jgi:hypothetical protein